MINEFRISARQYINGMSVHAELTVTVNPPQTEDFNVLAAAAQIELRTLLSQTYHEQLKTKQALNVPKNATARLHKRNKTQPAAQKPGRRLSAEPNRPKKRGADGTRQSARAARDRQDQTTAK